MKWNLTVKCSLSERYTSMPRVPMHKDNGQLYRESDRCSSFQLLVPCGMKSNLYVRLHVILIVCGYKWSSIFKAVVNGPLQHFKLCTNHLDYMLFKILFMQFLFPGPEYQTCILLKRPFYSAMLLLYATNVELFRRNPSYTSSTVREYTLLNRIFLKRFSFYEK